METLILNKKGKAFGNLFLFLIVLIGILVAMHITGMITLPTDNLIIKWGISALDKIKGILM